MPAKVDLPAPEGSNAVYLDGKKTDATRKDGRWILDREVTGTSRIVVK